MAKRYQRLEALRTPTERQEEADATANSKLEERYYISPSRNHPVEVIPFVQENPLDPAKKVLCCESILRMGLPKFHLEFCTNAANSFSWPRARARV